LKGLSSLEGVEERGDLVVGIKPQYLDVELVEIIVDDKTVIDPEFLIGKDQ
jgi:hypothetical protein